MEHPNVKSLFDLSGKVAMVTGGCRNFGLEIATGLAEAGADLVVTSRGLEKAQEAAAEHESLLGVRALAVELELLSEESVIAAFRRVKEHYGRLDVLVNNAGGHSPKTTGALETETLDAWNAYVDANLTGTFLCIREAARLMMKRGAGSIVNIGSVSSLLGRDRRVYDGTSMTPNPIPYTASKAGVVGLSCDTAAYLGRHGIRVNVISPGGFERGQPESFVQAYSSKTMLGRMGRDGVDLKGTVLFLASDASAYVTAHNLYVDGGFSRFQ